MKPLAKIIPPPPPPPLALLAALLLAAFASPAQAQSLRIEQSAWEPHPLFNRSPTFNRWITTLTIHYTPALPGPDVREFPQPLGFFEKMYCNANPNYSPRCTQSTGPTWGLAVDFTGNGTDYEVRHSSGRNITGTQDLIEDIPYGVGAVHYYVVGDGNGATGNVSAQLPGDSDSTVTGQLHLPSNPPR